MNWIFGIIVALFFAAVLSLAYSMSMQAVGFSDSNLDRSVRTTSGGGVYLPSGSPK